MNIADEIKRCIAAVQREGLTVTASAPLSVTPEAYKRRLHYQRYAPVKKARYEAKKHSPSGPTTGLNKQGVASRKEPPEQAGAGKPNNTKLS